jgi:hypothetical protein
MRQTGVDIRGSQPVLAIYSGEKPLELGFSNVLNHDDAVRTLGVASKETSGSV